MNTLIPGAPLRSLSPTSIEYQRAQGASRAAKPARAARFTLDAPEHSGTIPGAIGNILPPGVALTSNLAVIFTLNQYKLTSAVLWLNDKDLDIRCVRIKPYAYEGKTLIDVQQVVPLPEAADYQVQVRDKKRQERKGRRGTIADFTRYDVVVDGHTSMAQWKRNAILLVVKGIASHGVSPEKIAQVLQPLKGHRLFKVIQEGTEDPERFRNLATEASAAEGKRYDDGRWHTAQNDLLVHEGQTYALTNQWGKSWLEAMKLLKERFPQVELRWEESVRP